MPQSNGVAESSPLPGPSLVSRVSSPPSHTRESPSASWRSVSPVVCLVFSAVLLTVLPHITLKNASYRFRIAQQRHHNGAANTTVQIARLEVDMPATDAPASIDNTQETERPVQQDDSLVVADGGDAAQAEKELWRRFNNFSNVCHKNFPQAMKSRRRFEDGAMTSHGTLGNSFVCTRQRRILRLGGVGMANPSSEVFRWPQLTGGTPPVPIPTATLRDLVGKTVSWNPTVGVITTALLSMFHLLNDFLLPLYATLHTVYEQQWNMTSPTHDDAALMDLVLVYLDKQNRGHGSDAATVAFAKAMVPRGRGALRLRIDPSTVDRDPTVHCHCFGLLQPQSVLVSMAPDARLIDGDSWRRKATLHVKQRLNEQFGLLPFGTAVIPTKEFVPYGLWRGASSDDVDHHHSQRPPRLLFLLRNKTRLIGDAFKIADAARSVGFDVEVMTPEFVSVEQQARAARYADVLLAIHGQALTWMVMMDAVKTPHCREVIELMHYGRPLRRLHNVYELLAADNYLRYNRIRAVDATFDMRYISSREGEKQLMMKKPFPHRLRGFVRQTAFYDLQKVTAALKSSFDRTRLCVAENRPGVLPPADIAKSERAFGGK